MHMTLVWLLLKDIRIEMIILYADQNYSVNYQNHCNYLLNSSLALLLKKKTYLIFSKGLASHKTRFNPPFFLLYLVRKMAVVIWYCVSMYVALSFVFCLHFSVSVVSLFSSYIVDVFPSVLVCIPHLFSSKTIYDFCTAVYYYCLYLSNLVSYHKS